MSNPVIIPSIVSVRWREAHVAPSLWRWRSLAMREDYLSAPGGFR